MIEFLQNLDTNQRKLLDAVFEAHEKSALRDNVSSVIFLNAFVGSGSFSNAVSASLSSLGGLHAPLEKSYALLEHPDVRGRVDQLLSTGEKIPGWGNSFIRGRKDDLWEDVEEVLEKKYPARLAKIEAITQHLHARNKALFPNPSTYTAITAIILGIPAHLSPWVFVAGRLNGWLDLAMRR